MSIRSLYFFWVHKKKFFHDFDASIDVHENTILKSKIKTFIDRILILNTSFKIL